MVKRIIPIAFVSVAWLAAQATAQQQPSREQIQMMQNIQQMGEQMKQNMQDQGIDPQEYLGALRQQMQDGTLDRDTLMQDMVNRGIIDKNVQAQAQQMKEAMSKAQSPNLQQQLGATDEEWKVLSPKVQKVLNGLALLGQKARAGGMTGLAGDAPAGTNDVTKALRELRAAIADKMSTQETIRMKLDAWRTAREKAQADLAASRKELTELLTIRQEAVLAALEIL